MIKKDKKQEVIKAYQLSDNDIANKVKEIGVKTDSKSSSSIANSKEVKEEQISFKFVDTITTNTILDELKSLDLSKVTPIEAINLLYKYQEEIKR